MGITIYCAKCRNDFNPSKKACPQCHTPIPRENRTYRVRVKVGSQRISRTIGSYEAAKQIESKLRTQLVKGEFVDQRKKKPVPTMDEVWALYLADYSTRGKVYSIRAEANRYREYLQPRYGSKRLDTITPGDADKMKIDLSNNLTIHGTPYKPKTILHTIQLLSRLFRFADRRDLYKGSNPVSNLTLPKVNNVLVRFLDADQFKRLLDTLDTYRDQNTANLIRFLIFTGIRRGEAFKLEWRDVDLVNERVHLRDPKGGLDQYLPLNASATLVLRNQQSRKSLDATLVFPSKAGNLRLHLKEPWQEIKRLAGMPENFRVHDLRHNYASMLASSGAVDLNTLQALLTHKDNRTTQRYAHLHPSVLKAGTSVFDKIVAKAKAGDPEPPAQVVDLETERLKRKG